MAPNSSSPLKHPPLPKALVGLSSRAVDFAATPVVIRVGKPPIAYHVNKHLLSDASEFFRAAFGPRWVEGKLGAVDMPEDDAVAFNIYLNWLQRGVLSVDFGENYVDEIWSSIIAAYALGDKLLDTSFKDAITDAVSFMMSTKRSDGKCWLPIDTLKLAHEKLARDSKLNLLFAHRYVRSLNACDMVRETHPAGFLFNVAQELLRIQKQQSPESTMDATARCAFHEHAPGPENCYRSRRR